MTFLTLSCAHCSLVQSSPSSYPHIPWPLPMTPCNTPTLWFPSKLYQIHHINLPLYPSPLPGQPKHCCSFHNLPPIQTIIYVLLIDQVFFICSINWPQHFLLPLPLAIPCDHCPWWFLVPCTASNSSSCFLAPIIPGIFLWQLSLVVPCDHCCWCFLLSLPLAPPQFLCPWPSLEPIALIIHSNYCPWHFLVTTDYINSSMQWPLTFLCDHCLRQILVAMAIVNS